jgi:hypothetical protein
MAFLYLEVHARHASDVRPTQRVFGCTLGIKHRVYIYLKLLFRLKIGGIISSVLVRKYQYHTRMKQTH